MVYYPAGGLKSSPPFLSTTTPIRAKVTSGMVISTFLSAPIMYVSAWLLTIPLMDPAPLVTELQNVSFNISIVSLIALVWTIAVMLLSRKFKRLPHMFTLNLFVAQFLVCVSMILWNFVVHQDSVLVKVMTFSLLYSSLYSSYIWTGLIPLCLALTKRNDLLRLRPGVFIITGWGVPLLIVGGLLLVGERRLETIDSAFFYGRAQIISTAIVVAVSILLGGFSLMGLSQGAQGEPQDYQALDRASILGTTEDLRPQAEAEDQAPLGLSPDSEILREFQSCAAPQPMPDMIASLHRNNTSSIQTAQAGALPAGQQDSATPAQVQDEGQLVRHALLCLLLTVSLLANLSSCLWWLFNKDPGRLYLELQFFCAVANYGQGFISFGVFGLDRHLIMLPFKNRLQGLWHSKDSEQDPQSPPPEEVRLTCTQFVRYHRDQCVQDLVHIRSGSGESASGPVGESFL